MNKKKSIESKKSNLPMIIIAVVFIVAIGGIVGFNILSNNGNKTKTSSSAGKTETTIPVDTDLKILKSEVTETAKFYPYKAGDVYMEVLAVKAKDGTIRTALNTCQVCYSSGKGYYIQKGDTVVCQNCGNVFNISQIEKAKDGCNPVPVTATYKKDDGANIVISKTFMTQKKDLFLKWKK
jgi:hypothetical protein